MNLKIRHYLLTGLLVWLPMGVTVWLLTWLVGTMDGIFLAVLGALDAVIPGMHSLAESLRHMPGLGVILVAVVIYITGLFVTNIFGQWWLRQWSKVITRIPVVNSIYISFSALSTKPSVSPTHICSSPSAAHTYMVFHRPTQIMTCAVSTSCPLTK